VDQSHGDDGVSEAKRILYRAAFTTGESGAGELKEVEFDTVEEALRAACRDLRAGYQPIGIWAPDRSLIHPASAIREQCRSPAQR
jgi:hypothetical protein